MPATILVQECPHAQVTQPGQCHVAVAIPAQLAMNFTCLDAFSQPCCRHKARSGGSSFSFSPACMWRGAEWSRHCSSWRSSHTTGRDHSIKTFQLIEFDNKETYRQILFQVREKEKVKTWRENKKAGEKEGGEEEVFWVLEVRFFCKL